MSHTMYAVMVGAAQRITEDPITALGWAADGGPNVIVTARTPGHGPSRIVWTPAIAAGTQGTLYEAVLTEALGRART